MPSRWTSQSPGAGERGFRQLLQEELARRCARNAQYSLRAFATFLRIDHATLSQLLRGRRPCTERTIRRLGARLGLGADVLGAYVERERHGAAGGATAAAQAAQEAQAAQAARAAAVRELTHDTAALVAEWHHFAILELTRLEAFRPDVRWIARVLGITQDEVAIAVQRLLRLGLLEMKDRRTWVDRTGEAGLTLAGFADAAVRQLFERTRQLATEGAARAPGRTELSGLTVAVDSARIPAAIERVARFREELLQFLSGGAARDDVYRVEISLYPVTRIRSEEAPHGTPGSAVPDRDPAP